MSTLIFTSIYQDEVLFGHVFFDVFDLCFDLGHKPRRKQRNNDSNFSQSILGTKGFAVASPPFKAQPFPDIKSPETIRVGEDGKH